MIHAELAQAWAKLKADTPKLRIRNAADQLNVSELDLLLTRLGDGVTWLDVSGHQLASKLPGLGTVMALVRNDNAVHETTGVFGELKGGEQTGLFLGAQDQRLFFSKWAFVVAVEEDQRHSLQVFDATGTAVIKIYRKEATDVDAWNALIAEYSAELSQAPALEVATKLQRRAVSDIAQFRTEWLAITDVHQFHGLLKRHDADRLSALEAAGTDLAERVDVSACEAAITACRDRAIPLMTFVSNAGAVQIHTAVPQKLLRTGHWFNILDPGFNLHLSTEAIDSVWVIRRPTSDGQVTSLEAFDAQGNSIVQFFGERREGKAERADWRALMDELTAAEVTA